jgi:hypothetical protein
VIHDWVFLILWVTSLGVTLWGQKWKAKAERLADAIQYLIEERGTHVSVYLTWLGVFIWGSVATWLIFG